jgi:hypothetical protein
LHLLRFIHVQEHQNARQLRASGDRRRDSRIRAAIRPKLSGMNRPSRANEAAFNRAVDEVTGAAERLVRSLVTVTPPRNREEEARKAKERSQQRFSSSQA